MEGLDNDVAMSTETEQKKFQQVQQRLEQQKKDRDEKLKTQKEAESEHLVEEEDYTVIDQKFNERFQQLELNLVSWADKVGAGAAKEAIEAYFEQVFAEFKELREYVNNYTFAIPAAFFSGYQQKLNAFNDAYIQQKDQALPKKKFTFAKKGNLKKKADAPKAQVVQSVDQKYMDGNHLSIKGLRGQTLTVDEKEYEGKENVILEDLEDCQITIPFLVKCIYIRGMKRCKLFATGIRNACFVNEAVGASAEQPNEFFFASH